MKKLVKLSIAAIMIFALSSFAMKGKKKKIVTITIEVKGNCEQCKERIETALDVKYIKKAVYNIETQKLTVKYRADKMEEIQIHNIVAGIGHDTDKVKSSDKVYANLPECCKYRSGVKCTDHSHSDW